MKKFYTLLFALIAFVAGAQAENTVTKYSLTELSDAKTALTDLSDNLVVMFYQNDGNKRPIWIVGPTTSGGNLSLNKTAVTDITTNYDVTNMLFTLEKVEGEDNTYYIKANSNGEYISGAITSQSNFSNTNHDAVATVSDKTNAAKIVFSVGTQSPNNLLLNPSGTSIYLNVQQTARNGQWYENSLVNWWGGTGGYSQWQVYVPKTSETQVTTYTVKWNITYNNGTTVPGTENWTSEVESGGTATVPTSSYPFTTYKTTEDLTNITGDKTINATATFSTPFEASASYDDATWYYIKKANADNNYLNNSTNGSRIEVTGTAPSFGSDDSYKWAFVGNPIDGYQIINKTAGNGYYLYNNSTPSGGGSDNTFPIMGQDDDNNTAPSSQRWTLFDATTITLANKQYTPVSNRDFTFSPSNYESIKWNDRSGNLSYWTQADGGSCWYVDDVLTADGAVAADIKPYYDATGYFTLTDAAKAELVTAGYNATKTGYTKGEYDDLKAKRDDLLADNSNFKFPESGYYRIKSSGSRTWGDSYIGYGSTGTTINDKNGLKTITDKSSDASTVLYLEVVDQTNHTYKIEIQGKWATRATEVNTPIRITNDESDGGTFTLLPVTDYEKTGFCTIQQDQEINGHNHFHEATWTNTGVVIWDAGDPSYWQVVDIPASETVYTATLHTASDGSYATAYLPFPSKVSGATAYTGTIKSVGTEGSEGVIQLNQIDGTIPALTPVILYSESTSGGEATFTLDRDYETSTGFEKGILDGVTIATTVTASDNYLSLGTDGTNVGFYQWAGTLTNKAYLDTSKLTASNTSKGFAFSFGGDDDPTGIQSATESAEAFDADAPRYNLQGQRVGKDYKGIIVVKGQKYLVR